MLWANVAAMGGATMFVFLNAFLLRGGLDEWHIGVCDGGFWIISVLLQPWLGPQLDRRGPVAFLRLGTALMALAALGYTLTPASLWAIFPLRVLQGAGFALYLTSAWAWISSQASPERMHTIFGFFGLSGLLGSLLGPVAAQLLRGPEPHNDLRVFLVASAVLGMATIMLFTLQNCASDREKAPEQFSESLWALARRPALRGPLVGSLSFGLAVGSIFAFAAAYLEGIGVKAISELFVVLTLVAAVGRGFCGPLSHRFGSSPLMMPCLLALALGSGGLGMLQFFHPPPVGLVMLTGGVAGVGYGLVYPLLNALAYERLQPHERGRGVSLVAACIDSGNASGAAVAGGLAHYRGEGDMFLAMAAAVALTAIWAKVSDRHEAR
jgi:MFS family permease